MNTEEFTALLIRFLNESCTPYHAIKNLASMLDANGFAELPETQRWDLKPGCGYYVIRNGSSIAAFKMPRLGNEESGLRIVGAHTDSPCLKLRPNPDLNKSGYGMIGVEIYGSALLRTWFDRDLSIAGRVYYADANGDVRHCLIDVADPVAIIPSLAIHLKHIKDSETPIAKHDSLNAMFASPDGLNAGNGSVMELIERVCRQTDPNMQTVLDFDLNLYDCARASRFGNDGEFIASARIDNLLSCYAAARALCDYAGGCFAMTVCNDHEEVGSVSDSGAQGPFLSSVIERTVGRDTRIMRRSMLVSADGAHGIHPNYPDRHDPQHAPLINGGIAIKRNSNQRYATTGETAALFANLCDSLGVARQVFISRNDMPCGSTIGPITAAELGIRTLDVGVPQFAMHSIRETAGIFDAHRLYCALRGFYGAELAQIQELIR